ncbi:hypothetical protein CAMGR0001_1585 [Campylobacter gracilis RM3268]|uniref:Uncharacterized protein n=1 Tax=Campylobacter gracilis RM3268 TaxID=553220 RepID=C8PK34_9BACT|nr:hypothetical protein CAMGR0001_1585 [Campylobacter gracilis RM3268]
MADFLKFSLKKLKFNLKIFKFYPKIPLALRMRTQMKFQAKFRV